MAGILWGARRAHQTGGLQHSAFESLLLCGHSIMTGILRGARRVHQTGGLQRSAFESLLFVYHNDLTLYWDRRHLGQLRGIVLSVVVIPFNLDQEIPSQMVSHHPSHA